MLSPTTQTTRTKLSPAQSLFKSLMQQPASPLGHHSATGSGLATSSPHYSPSTIHVEKPSESASLKTSSAQAKIACVSPTISRVTPIAPPKPIEDIFRYFNLCRTSSPNNEIQVFDKVSTQDFETLENIGLSNRRGQNHRSSHHPVTGLLIIEMPTPAHEFAITDFSRFVQPALDALPIDQCIRVTLEHNLTLRSAVTGFAATPDLALVSISTGQTWSKNIFAVVECACSQDHNSLMQKIRDEVEGWPKITLVVAVIVTEDSQIHSLSSRFSIPPPSLSEHIPLGTILSESDINSDSDDELVRLNPNGITIAGHTWCHVRSVQYQVWVKENGVLDLNGDSANGFLYPTIEMDEVEEAISSGLFAVKDEIIKVATKSTKSGSESALRNLQSAQLRVNFDWAKTQITIKMAAEQTALSRYETWFYKNFCGTKRPLWDDQSYCPSESQSGSSLTSLQPQDAAHPRY